MSILYDINIDTNTSRDLLILPYLLCTNDYKLFTSIFEKIKEINTAFDLIDLVYSVEASLGQSSRLLGNTGQVR